MSFKPFNDQNYESIKAQCLKQGKLFEDDKFPATSSSIFKFQNMLGNRPVTWKRPFEICKNPEFIHNVIEPNDLDQGQIGNCWVIASAAAVLNVPDYLNRVIPANQTFDKANYAGIFHFRFWSNGEWVDVVVDDRIPVDANNNIVFCRNSVDKNEMFGSLLEKAYAKLNICYEFLVGGNPKDALIDFTGGVNETLDLTRSSSKAAKDRFIEPNRLWELMFKSHNLKSLSSCAANVKAGQKMEGKQPNGLVVGHAYSLMTVYEIYSKNGQLNTFRGATEPPQPQSIRLIKLRNPWGQSTSYQGPWSTGSKDWNQIGENVKKILNPNNQSDGQFFMSFQDYVEFFDTMDTVHVDLNGISNAELTNNGQLKWDIINYKGEWIPGQNSGGCGNDPKLFWSNPQYQLTLPPVKDKTKIALIVSLLQTETAKRRSETNGTFGSSFEALGFSVYTINPGVKPKSRYEREDIKECDRLQTLLYQREVSKRCELPPGNYVIIPYLFQANKAMKFLMRINFESNSVVLNQKPDVVNPNINANNNNVNNNTKPIVAIDPVPAPAPKPAPVPVPVVVVDTTDNYDKWYYGGMKKNDIDNLGKQAQLATSKACSIM